MVAVTVADNRARPDDRDKWALDHPTERGVGGRRVGVGVLATNLTEQHE